MLGQTSILVFEKKKSSAFKYLSFHDAVNVISLKIIDIYVLQILFLMRYCNG